MPSFWQHSSSLFPKADRKKDAAPSEWQVHLRGEAIQEFEQGRLGLTMGRCGFYQAHPLLHGMVSPAIFGAGSRKDGSLAPVFGEEPNQVKGARNPIQISCGIPVFAGRRIPREMTKICCFSALNYPLNTHLSGNVYMIKVSAFN